jgi:hypothetical protein
MTKKIPEFNVPSSTEEIDTNSIEYRITEIGKKMQQIESRRNPETDLLTEEDEKEMARLVKENEELVGDNVLHSKRHTKTVPDTSKKNIQPVVKNEINASYISVLKEIIDVYRSLPNNSYSKTLQDNIKKSMIDEFHKLNDEDIFDLLINYIFK